MTDLPDHSFGLGHSTRIDSERMKGITEKIRMKLKMEENDFGEFQRLVNAAALEGRDTAMRSHDEDLRVTIKEGREKPGTGVYVSAVNNIEPEEVGNVTAWSSNENQGAKHVEGSPYASRALSKFELDSLERKKEGRRRRIEEGLPQTAAGRVFSGSGFVSKPKEIVIKDFVPGKKYIRRFTLTNASYAFNSFKLLPFDASQASFMSVSYERLGRMSAGVSCTVELSFMPQVDEDVETFLRFHSETGPGSVAIKCIKRRCGARLLEERIDFGRCVIGDLMSKTVKVANAECLGTRFSIEKISSMSDSLQPCTISVDEPSDILVEEEPSENILSPEDILRDRVAAITSAIIEQKRKEQPTAIACSMGEGYIDGHSNVDLNFTFSPLEAGFFEEVFQIRFLDSPDSQQTASQLLVCGVGEESPVYMESKEVHFGCVYLNKIYRNSFEVRNRGSVSKKVEFQGDHAISDLIEVTPTIAIIQPFDSLKFNMKFTPNPNNLLRIQKFMVSLPGFEYASQMVLPLRMDVSNLRSKAH